MNATSNENKISGVRLGILTPSSNTVLEPLTTEIVSGLPGVSAHFSRFRVTRISLDDEDLRQFDNRPIMEAAELLADAHASVIAWSGTSGSWLGAQNDFALCEAITAATGVPTTTCTLGMNDIFRRGGMTKVGLISPYLASVQERIIENYRSLGIDCSIERHLGDPGNFSFAGWTEDTVEEMIRDVAAKRPEAIVIMCTNFKGARLVARLEAELGVPIYDSVSVTVWKALQVAGVSTQSITGWGRLFQEFDLERAA